MRPDVVSTGRRALACLITSALCAAAVVVGTGGPAQAASTTTVTSPSPGSVSSTGAVDIAGTYTATNLQSVKVVLCKKEPTAPSGCLWVNSRTAGTTRATWFGFNATTTGNQFSLGFSGLPDGSYELRTYVLTAPPARTAVPAPPRRSRSRSPRRSRRAGSASPSAARCGRWRTRPPAPA